MGMKNETLTISLPGAVTMEFVRIPAGSFWMGSPEGETGRREDETRHFVTLTKDFYLAVTSVTQRQYQAVTGRNPSGFARLPQRPVETVSWHDAAEFCKRCSRLDGIPEGWRMALPTEAQWEYACRAGAAGALYTGKDLTVADGKCPNLEPIAWYRYNHPSQGPLDVGTKEPNAFGLYDMLGNIHEWVRDRYGDYPTDPQTDPEGPASGYDCIVRGGNWQSSPWKCRAARRGIDPPSYRLPGTGFRAALVSDGV